jgi:cellulose synthase/poly-beta-1,6-N-acetylglucosamine synthase-like glycosyltransferase
MIREVLEVLFVLLTGFMIVYMVRHYVFTFSVLRKAKTLGSMKPATQMSFAPSVTVLIPARNEERVIERLLRRMVELTYPKDKLEVIVIDDASSDDTGKIADAYALRHKFIRVLHRDQDVGGKGKASALNAGFKSSRGAIVICFDADYCPQRDIVEKLVMEFADAKVGVVQGRPVVLNEPQNIVTRLVALERIGGYRVDQEARNNLGLTPQFGGTVGGFRRCLLEELGGFDESMLTEDTDLTFQARLKGYEVRYTGEAECYEEAVDTWKAYWRQRHRWAKGHMQVCFKHTWGVLKSKKLTAKEKIDGLLLLNIYFMPVIALLSFIVGVSLIIAGFSPLDNVLWFSVAVSFYSFVGNFAPFFEVGIGAYLDGRTRIQWLAPLLLFAFLYNILICTKAFLDVAAGKILGVSRNNWVKTPHSGRGNRYITN